MAATQPQQAGSIRGFVIDRYFQDPVEGVEVRILETGQVALTGPQGNFVFPQVKPGTYTLVFSRPDYLKETKSPVVVTPGAGVELSISLSGDFTDLPDFVVEDVLQGGAGSEAALLALRFETPALVDSIGSDLMSRAGASDAASAARLISGVSTQGDKFAVIRGLPDRYISTQMNAVRLPSANEDKRAVELDQFPSNILESIQVSKTFTPDQQGDASGGAVNVVLRGIPEEASLSVRGQFGANSQVTGIGNFLTYNGGGISFFGDDGGKRDIQFENLGQNWAGSVGVTDGAAPIDSKWSIAGGGRQELDSGLIVGGFATVFYERDSSFYSNGQDNSLWLLNPGENVTPQFAQDFAGQTNVTSLFDVTRASQSVSWGSLATLGVEGENSKLSLTLLGTHTAEDTATLALDTRGKEFYFPGYDPNDPNSAGNDPENISTAPYLRSETLEYTERTTKTVQVRGEHEFQTEDVAFFDGDFEIQQPVLEWTLSRNFAKQYQPDKRLFGAFWTPAYSVPFGQTTFNFPAVWTSLPPADNVNFGNLQRIWKDIREDGEQVSTNLKLPFEQWGGEKGYVKVGAFYDRVTRGFNQDTFSNFNDFGQYEGGFDDPFSAVFPNEDHPISASVFDIDYNAQQRIQSFYFMFDMPLSSQVNLVAGARAESTNIELVNIPEAFAFYYFSAPDGNVTQVNLTPGVADVDFSQDDVLPAIGLEYQPTDRLTLRAAYSQTIARQTFKELTPIQQQEFFGGPVFIGNPDLQMAALKNFDLRADYAPYPGGLVSLSWFYKDITNPIEYIQRSALNFDFTTPVNYPDGKLSGWEIELRQQLGRFDESLEGLGLIANATLIDAQVTISPLESAAFASPQVLGQTVTSRDMLNAPEYIYNLGTTYDLEASGTQLGLFYSVTGDTLVAGAGVSNGNYFPDVYQTSIGTLNFSITQRIADGVSIQFQAKNLTNPEIEQVYRSDFTGPDAIRSTFTKGIDLSLGIAMTF